MATMPGVIDLGELPRGEPTEVEAPWPVRERLRRLRSRQLRWAAMAAGLAGLVLATTGAAAGQLRPAVTLTFTVPARGFAVDHENLYVLESGEPGERVLTAYRLDDGTVRWRHSSSLLSDFSWMDTWLGPLLVTSYSASGGGGTRDFTTRFDTATGRPLWSHDGQLSGVAGDLVLLQHRPETEPTVDQPVPPSEVTAVDLHTGDPVWSLTLTSWSYQSEPGPGRLAGLAQDGRMTTYDLDTGERLASVRTDASPDRTQPMVIGSIVLLQNLPDRSAVIAYDVDTLAPRWERPELGGWVLACGQLLCSAGTGRPEAIDPETGEVAWSADWMPAGGSENWFDILDPEASLLDGYLVLSRVGVTGVDQRTWLVDQETGEPVLDLRHWVFPYPPAGEPQPILLWHEEGQAWVGRLREDLSGVRVHGSIAVTVLPELGYSGCQSVPPHVICWVQFSPEPDRAELRVWRIR